jgi:hypothetical protein
MCLSVVGELDDYDRLRRSANEHWRTMQYYFDEVCCLPHSLQDHHKQNDICF